VIESNAFVESKLNSLWNFWHERKFANSFHGWRAYFIRGKTLLFHAGYALDQLRIAEEKRCSGHTFVISASSSSTSSRSSTTSFAKTRGVAMRESESDIDEFDVGEKDQDAIPFSLSESGEDDSSFIHSSSSSSSVADGANIGYGLDNVFVSSGSDSSGSFRLLSKSSKTKASKTKTSISLAQRKQRRSNSNLKRLKVVKRTTTRRRGSLSPGIVDHRVLELLLRYVYALMI
jgi:hypothetical protein